MKLQFSYTVEQTENENGPYYIIHAEPYGDTIPMWLGLGPIPPLSSVASCSVHGSLSVLAMSLKEAAHFYELDTSEEVATIYESGDDRFDAVVGFIDEDGVETNVKAAAVTLHGA